MSSKHITFSAEKRELAGKGVARALRRENKIPAVIYGDNKEPVMISLSSKDANLQYNRGHMFTTLSDITVDGQKFLTLARDVQLCPVKDNVLHIDFLRVSPKTKINVMVPVHFNNEDDAPYAKQGGILNIARHEVELNCQATDIPEYVQIDLAGLKVEIGDSIKSSEVKWPAGTKPVMDREFTIASIIAPKTAAQEDAESAANAEGIAKAAEEGKAANDAAKAADNKDKAKDK